MELCDVCESIPWHDLPAFPDDHYDRGTSGYDHYQTLTLKKNVSYSEPNHGIPHHPDDESLRCAAALGCGLCALIVRQVDAMLTDLDEYDSVYFEPGECDWPPALEFWVSRRSGLGDGAWVTARGSETGGRLTIAAALVFVSDDGDPMAPLMRGRRVVDSPDTRAMDFVIRQLEDCNKYHACLDVAEPAPLPTRVIDVGTPASGPTVKLIEPPPGTAARYLTLSYCWGEGVKSFTTTRSLLADRKKGMRIKDLPQTFRDAVVLTRRIGERYLWIDSLCICQDDRDDWERESSRMAAVYSNAYLVLAATGASSSAGGLFAPQKSREYVRLPYTAPDGTRTHVWACIVLQSKDFDPSFYVAMKEQPLSRRGWCFQERVLARRTAHFATDQTYFECREGLTSQDGLDIPIRFYSTCTNPDDLPRPLPFLVHEKSRSWRGFGASRSALSRWFALVSEYGNRRLTFPGDKLPAIAGIAKEFSTLIDDEYLAGMWRGPLLVRCLAWQSIECTATSEYRAPSWSWASVDGVPAVGSLDERVIDLATIVDCGVEVDALNPFGGVKHGWITMEAPLVKALLCERVDVDDPDEHMNLRTEKGDAFGIHTAFDTIAGEYEESAEMVSSMSLYIVLLGRLPFDASGDAVESSCSESASNSGSDAGAGVYQALIVTPAGDSGDVDEGRFKRVGWMCPSVAELGLDEVDSSKRLITLV